MHNASFLEIQMPTHLSIKNAPDAIVTRLKKRAVRNHRSLQGELMAILEEAVRTPAVLTPDEVLARVRKLGLRTPAESNKMTREDRDAR
jgi:antitoxin FitA